MTLLQPPSIQPLRAKPLPLGTWHGTVHTRGYTRTPNSVAWAAFCGLRDRESALNQRLAFVLRPTSAWQAIGCTFGTELLPKSVKLQHAGAAMQMPVSTRFKL